MPCDHRDLRAAHLEGGTNAFSAAGSGPWQPQQSKTRIPEAPRLPAWLGFAAKARPEAGCSPLGENYSARRPLRASPTFPPLAATACLLSDRSRTRLARKGLRPQERGYCGGPSPSAGRRQGGAKQSRPHPCPRSRPVPGSGVPAVLLPRPVRSRRRRGGAAHEVKMVIRVFVASSSGSLAIKKRQQDVVRFLEANRIEFEEVDITMSEEKRQWMYKNIPEDRQPAQGNPLPPQIFSDDRYCGDYDGFFESKESNTVFSFLGLKPTLASKQSEP
ncbi:SH3 domain-binding glutamic acid-rich-like protein 2 [Calypte anna]|uniref:SH3 domain-binding glutamic acid-rich-like protein 2 n=2 Tax=Trochilidae TaxID=9242 RepID=UPI0011C394B4|nr:SH3 domain-binding glutamic acid-rich-like protein 2 [Calypte anna]